MIGWLLLALIGAAAVGLLWLMQVRGGMLLLCSAALLLGASGYAIQGRPGLPGSPGAEQAAAQAVPLTGLRHAFYGNFTATEHWLLLSESLARRGDTRAAAGALQAAVREHPGDPHLWVGLGNALVDHSRGLSPASEYAFRRAAELSPGYPAPLFFYGLALLRSGDRDGAVRLWREVLASDPAEAKWRPLVEDALAATSAPPQQQQR